MKILFIEDDEEKANQITAFVQQEFPDAVISMARSFSSGLQALIAHKANLSLVLLDMTMPNYDVSVTDPSGGNPEHYAGRDLLSQMKLRRITIPTIVVTMFDSFGEGGSKISLDQLTKQLHKEFSPTFKGYVYYNSVQVEWKKSLRELIQSISRSTT